MHSNLWEMAALLAGAVGLVPSESTFAKELAAARAARLARLTTPDGWLTLIGLHFLAEGENSVGTAAENAIVLAAGPAHVGTVTLAPNGTVTLAVASGVDARIGGRPVGTATLQSDANHQEPTLVTLGTVSFFVIDRGGKQALRVKDSESVRRAHFLGLDYFPSEERWRIEAQWLPAEPGKKMPVPNVLGQTDWEPVPGKAVFEHDGKTCELMPFDQGAENPLFFVIADATRGKETYGGGRFLYADWPKDGKVVLDFNRAINPPCAFTPFAACPLPLPENRLPFAVTAGEKNYRGGHA